MTRRDRRDWEHLQDRWAAGERLSADEEARRQTLGAADPVARRELEAFGAMKELLDRSDTAVADETLTDRVLERAGVAGRHKLLYLPRRAAKHGGPAAEGEAPLSAPTRAMARPAFAAMAAALALIAAVYAGRAFESRRQETTAARPPAPEEAEARLTSASGEVQIAPSSAGGAAPAGFAPGQGRLLRTGDRVRTGKGSACLRLQPAIDVCLGPDSDVEIGSLRPPQLQVAVARGVAVAALAPRAAGQSFALVGGDVVAVAHGTVYALDRSSAVSVDVVVLEGTVAVQAPGQGGLPEMIPAHTRWRSQTATRLTLRSEEEGSFAALLAPNVPNHPVAATAEAPPRLRSVKEAPRPLHSAGVDSPDLCLSRARAALDRGDRRAALDWYRRLRDRFPNDEAARTVLVTSGRLEMELGASARALDEFQAYLRVGDGALEMEASAGAARALRALGRAEEERRAIDRYLARFPNGFDAPLLRSRRAELDRSARAHESDSPR